VYFKFAEQPEVNVAYFARRPVVEQMLAVGLNLAENGAIDTLGIAGKTSLGTGDPQGPTAEQLSVVSGNFVNGVSFWHEGHRTGRPVRVRCCRAPWRVEP